ncbi:MAG: hypothetical protein AAFR55_05620 [Pseudomonadota bacterium]
MTLFEELFVSVMGGIITAIVLAAFTRRRASEPAVPHEAPLTRREAARQQRSVAPRRSGFVTGFLGFVRVTIAVTAGIAIAMVGGRWLIQNGILPRGLPTRFGVLIVATAVVWLLLGVFRRR